MSRQHLLLSFTVMLVNFLTISAEATNWGRESEFRRDLESEFGASSRQRNHEEVESSEEASIDGKRINVLEYWPILVYINKADQGRDAQTAYIYVEGVLRYRWRVSTGREKWEKAVSGKEYFSSTPVGWFSPQRMEIDYWSKTWDAPMPYAVFFEGGVAVHATTESHYAELGTRASGGCVRLKLEHAKILFDLIKSFGEGSVPAFSKSGRVKVEFWGGLQMKQGSNTLIMVEDRVIPHSRR